MLARPAALRADTLTVNTKPPADAEGSGEFWWERDPTPQGMVTASWTYANDTDGPNTQGLRVAYGPLGAGDEYYGWAEYWLAFRQAEARRITSAGLSLVPISLLYRRIGVGFLLDIGLERRKDRDRAALSGLIGGGAEFVVRLFRRWDFVSTAEAAFRTTVDVESQLRFAIRFHHEKISVWKEQ